MKFHGIPFIDVMKLPVVPKDGKNCTKCGKELAYVNRATGGYCSGCIPLIGFSQPRSVRRAANRVGRIGRRGRKARRIVQRAADRS